MKIKAIIKAVSLSLVTSFAFTCTSCSTDYETFSFASHKTAEKVAYKLIYDDAYFDKNASEYQTHLATASMSLALAGFPATSGIDYARSPDNIKEFFTKIGFNDFQSNDFGVSQPTAHSFGVYIASKEVKDYTLIGIGVRGDNYYAEWVSNMTFGDNPQFADGYYGASNIYLDALKSYINDFKISGKIKIWTAGYSRGGTGINLAIGRMDDALINGENILSPKVSYTKEDLYAYCFEAPAGRIATFDEGKILQKGDNYNNIHCLLNVNDFIPYLAPIQYGFVRYGIDYYLPDITNTLDYNLHISRVKDKLGGLGNASIINDYLIDQFQESLMLSFAEKYNPTLGNFLVTFMDLLSTGLISRSDYVKNNQQQIANLFSLIYKNGSPKDSLIDLIIKIGTNILLADPEEALLKDLQYNPDRFLQDLDPILKNALSNTDIDMGVNDLIEMVRNIIITIATIASLDNGLNCLISLCSLSNLKCIDYGNIPELTLSHMVSMDDNYTDGNLLSPATSYYQVSISGDNKEYEITHNGTLLAASTDLEINTVLVAERYQDEDIFYIPKVDNIIINSSSDNLFVEVDLMSGEYYPYNIYKMGLLNIDEHMEF